MSPLKTVCFLEIIEALWLRWLIPFNGKTIILLLHFVEILEHGAIPSIHHKDEI